MLLPLLLLLFNFDQYFRALRDVWPQSLQKVNLIEPSQSMQRAGRLLIQGRLLTIFSIYHEQTPKSPAISRVYGSTFEIYFLWQYND